MALARRTLIRRYSYRSAAPTPARSSRRVWPGPRPLPRPRAAISPRRRRTLRRRRNGPYGTEGCGFFDVTQEGGERVSTARHYLGARSTRISVVTAALVNRVLFDGSRATGVECRRGSQVHTAFASGGAARYGPADGQTKRFAHSSHHA
ncbi:MAG: GMC family oxidoreductase N-terminal domain-containing protein [Bryobacteraceae bacterium]